jgi:hypothetical protein
LGADIADASGDEADLALLNLKWLPTGSEASSIARCGKLNLGRRFRRDSLVRLFFSMSSEIRCPKIRRDFSLSTKLSSRLRILLLVVLVACIGCDISIPGIDSNQDNLAPWTKIPENGGLTYVEKYRRTGMEPRFLAMAKFSKSSDVDQFIDYFQLKKVDSIKSVWPSTFDASGLTLDRDTTMYSASVPEKTGFDPNGTGIVVNLWVDQVNKVLIIERSWELGRY